MVRQRGGKTGPSRIKLCRTDSVDALVGQAHRDEGKRSCAQTPHTVHSHRHPHTEYNFKKKSIQLSDVGMEVTVAPPAGADQAVEKAKKRYRKKKTKLEEAFPSYLQVTHTHTLCLNPGSASFKCIFEGLLRHNANWPS